MIYVFFSFSSLPMCYRFSHRVNFQRATYPSSPLIFSTESPASHPTLWLSSPLCNHHCWELPHWWMFSLMSLRKPEERIFFLDTMGMCGMYPDKFCFFFPPPQSFFLLSFWYFCPSQQNSGMDQTRISLIWPFLCCISIYLSFILMFGDALKKNQDIWCTRMSDYLGGLFLSSVFYWLSFIFSRERIILAVALQWLQRHFTI